MPALREGQKAPNFKLNDKDGRAHTLGAPGVSYTVLYFYPKDSTPGCTLEAQEFTASLKEFKSRGVRIIGVSGGDKSSKAKFCSKYKLAIPLVSDTDFKVAKSYGAYGDKKFMGRSFKGIFRKTFILDNNGTVVRVFEAVKPEGHAREVLKAVDLLARKGKATKATTSSKRKSAPKRVATKTRTVRGAAKRTAKRVAPKTTARRTPVRKAATSRKKK